MMVRTSEPVHGIRFHQEPGPRGLGWWQYWRGVRHTWRWHGIGVWSALRKRDRPMYELTSRISGSW